MRLAPMPWLSPAGVGLCHLAAAAVATAAAPWGVAGRHPRPLIPRQALQAGRSISLRPGCRLRTTLTCSRGSRRHRPQCMQRARPRRATRIHMWGCWRGRRSCRAAVRARAAPAHRQGSSLPPQPLGQPAMLHPLALRRPGYQLPHRGVVTPMVQPQWSPAAASTVQARLTARRRPQSRLAAHRSRPRCELMLGPVQQRMRLRGLTQAPGGTRAPHRARWAQPRQRRWPSLAAEPVTARSSGGSRSSPGGVTGSRTGNVAARRGPPLPLPTTGQTGTGTGGTGDEAGTGTGGVIAAGTGIGTGTGTGAGSAAGIGTGTGTAGTLGETGTGTATAGHGSATGIGSASAETTGQGTATGRTAGAPRTGATATGRAGCWQLRLGHVLPCRRPARDVRSPAPLG